MKKIFFFTAITILMLSSSCKKEVTPLSQDRTATERVSSSSAAVPFHVNFEESVEGFQIYNSCTNELMTLHGSIHDVFHGLYDGPDSKITFHYNFQESVSAVGESGTEYIVTGTLNAQEGEFSVGEFTFKFINKYRFITKGGGNNFFYELTHYLKVDAEGNWTIIREEVEKTYCQ